MKNNLSATLVYSNESKAVCRTCGTELIQNPDCAAATVNPTWCPQCKSYPAAAVVAGCWVPMNMPMVAIPQVEYERLKKENEKLKQSGAALMGTHIGNIAEIEQLKMLNAVYKRTLEALKEGEEQYHGFVSSFGLDLENLPGYKAIVNALSADKSTEYHNPADVEVLKKAKEALISSNQYKCGHCWGTYMNHKDNCLVKQALDAIEKATGWDKATEEVMNKFISDDKAGGEKG